MAAGTWIPPDTFGTRLLLARKGRGFTVEQAARACGIAQPTWTTWENGARPRDLVQAIAKISVALDVDRDWLMWGGPLAASAVAEQPAPVQTRSRGRGSRGTTSGWSADRRRRADRFAALRPLAPLPAVHAA